MRLCAPPDRRRFHLRLLSVVPLPTPTHESLFNATGGEFPPPLAQPLPLSDVQEATAARLGPLLAAAHATHDGPTACLGRCDAFGPCMDQLTDAVGRYLESGQVGIDDVVEAGQSLLPLVGCPSRKSFVRRLLQVPSMAMNVDRLINFYLASKRSTAWFADIDPQCARVCQVPNNAREWAQLALADLHALIGASRWSRAALIAVECAKHRVSSVHEVISAYGFLSFVLGHPLDLMSVMVAWAGLENLRLGPTNRKTSSWNVDTSLVLPFAWMALFMCCQAHRPLHERLKESLVGNPSVISSLGMMPWSDIFTGERDSFCHELGKCMRATGAESNMTRYFMDVEFFAAVESQVACLQWLSDQSKDPDLHIDSSADPIGSAKEAAAGASRLMAGRLIDGLRPAGPAISASLRDLRGRLEAGGEINLPELIADICQTARKLPSDLRGVKDDHGYDFETSPTRVYVDNFITKNMGTIAGKTAELTTDPQTRRLLLAAVALTANCVFDVEAWDIDVVLTGLHSEDTRLALCARRLKPLGVWLKSVSQVDFIGGNVEVRGTPHAPPGETSLFKNLLFRFLFGLASFDPYALPDRLDFSLLETLFAIEAIIDSLLPCLRLTDVPGARDLQFYRHFVRHLLRHETSARLSRRPAFSNMLTEAVLRRRNLDAHVADCAACSAVEGRGGHTDCSQCRRLCKMLKVGIAAVEIAESTAASVFESAPACDGSFFDFINNLETPHKPTTTVTTVKARTSLKPIGARTSVKPAALQATKTALGPVSAPKRSSRRRRPVDRGLKPCEHVLNRGPRGRLLQSDEVIRRRVRVACAAPVGHMRSVDVGSLRCLMSTY